MESKTGLQDFTGCLALKKPGLNPENLEILSIISRS
jgi:hypothetical protein